MALHDRYEIANMPKADLCLQQMTDLDPIAERIVQELSRDGRLSNIALADRVGLSPSACLRRVQALERVGIIAGYRAVVDPAALVVLAAAISYGSALSATQLNASASLPKPCVISETARPAGKSCTTPVSELASCNAHRAGSPTITRP